MAAREAGSRAVLLRQLGLRLQRRQAAQRRCHSARRKRTPIPPCPKTATVGRSSSPSGCAAISAKTSACCTRVARFHNVYGPLGTWDGGREKAPAAVCRKVIHAIETGNHEIEIWGDGNQTRSFMYIDDCITGINRILYSDIEEPINLGSSELVTINGLVDIVEDIAGVKLKRKYLLDAPKGVNGRNSDNTRIQELLGWEPSIRLRDGMEKTFRWIQQRIPQSAPARRSQDELSREHDREESRRETPGGSCSSAGST